MTRITTKLFFFCALVLCAAQALAGPLDTAANSDVYVDGFSNVWRGSTTFSGSGVSGTLDGYVDWAVYAAGDFPGFSNYTPTPDEFVYAYQIYVTGDVEAGAKAATSLFVTIPEDHPADNIGWFSGDAGFGSVSGTGVSFNTFASNAAQWYFLSPAVAPGANSVGLAFSSPNVPEINDGSVLDGGIVASVFPLPTAGAQAVPEPGTLALAAVGLAGSALFWLRRRRTAK